MSKKQEFLRDQRSRDKHPESGMVGSASSVDQERGRQALHGVTPEDRHEPHSGKVANDHNKAGSARPTQTNGGRRTPQSRHDRESMAGTMNVVQARTGGKGGGRGTRGGNGGGGA